MTKHRFEPRPDRHLAIRPDALAYEHDEPKKAPFEMRDGVAVVRIDGPLSHHAGWWCDSYDEIKCRVGEALAARPASVMLVIDSPGGEVSGCFETARELRAMAEAARVPLVTYVDGMAASAGYALACCGSTIYTPQTAILGSVGVISGLVDMTEALTSWGIRVRLVTSGERKADGHPYQAISDGAVAALQSMVDTLAGIFFQWVAEARAGAGLTVESIRAMEAGVVLGADAKRAGLADEVVATLDEAIALVASRPSAAPAPASIARAGARAATSNTTARSAGTEKKIMPLTTKPRAEDQKPAEDENKDKPAAAVEECDLAKLREAMAMPDQPAQEVVDAAASKIADMTGEEEGGEDAEKADAKAQLASERQANAKLRADMTALAARVALLEPLAAEKATRDREAAIDAEIAKRKMACTAEQRASFVALASEFGIKAALASIAAAHVPPGGTIGGNPGATSTSSGDPIVAPVSNDAAKTAAVRAEAERIQKERPGLSAHQVQREAMAAARAKHPNLYAPNAG